MTDGTIPITDPSDSTADVALGVDVGGTNIKLGLVCANHEVLAEWTLSTHEERGPQDALTRICQTLNDFLDQHNIERKRLLTAGLATPGTMDIPGGLILRPPNMPHWVNYPVRDEFAQLLGVPVAYLNDGSAAAFGEFWAGTGRDHSNMIMLTLGTGVGGGIIIDGNLLHGVNSFGSECGHIVVDSSDDARTCVWGGGQGQLEAYASASALVARVLDRIASGESSQLSEQGESLTAKDIYDAAGVGDTLAVESIEKTAYYLGIAVTTLVHTIDPGLVVLGGAMGFGGAGDPIGSRFIDVIRQEFVRRAFPLVGERTTIDFASLGSSAGYIGAAGYALATMDGSGI
jgi:glucokinase